MRKVNMRKILFVYDYLEYGGIASYLITLLNNLNHNDYKVSLLLNGGNNELLKTINSNVEVIILKKMNIFQRAIYYLLNGLFFNLLRITFISNTSTKVIRDIQKLQYVRSKYSPAISGYYDIVVGCDHFWPNYYVISNFDTSYKILWIHPDYSSLEVDRKLDYSYFEKANKIAFVSEISADLFLEIFPMMKEKVVIIENIVESSKIIEMSKAIITDTFSEEQLNVVTVCRLDNQSKRIDRIVLTCLELKRRKLNFVWRIIGDGEDKNSIIKMIKRVGLANELIIMGQKSNPFPYVAQSDVFVLLSQYEGKPIAVSEAMCLGVEIIVSNYVSAKSQVESYGGHIVDNDDKVIVTQVADAMQQIKIRQKRIRISDNKGEIIDKINTLFGGAG